MQQRQERPAGGEACALHYNRESVARRQPESGHGCRSCLLLPVLRDVDESTHTQMPLCLAAVLSLTRESFKTTGVLFRVLNEDHLFETSPRFRKDRWTIFEYEPEQRRISKSVRLAGRRRSDPKVHACRGVSGSMVGALLWWTQARFHYAAIRGAEERINKAREDGRLALPGLMSGRSFMMPSGLEVGVALKA